MSQSISFVLDGSVETIDFRASQFTPTTTVLQLLRNHPRHKGVKEGCAEGDCGACTVVLGEIEPGGNLRYRAVDSCLVFLPMIHGKQLITVENLKDAEGTLHAVQEAMVDTDGSQCGYCTPGFIMSLFALYRDQDTVDRPAIDDALTGNLCRCTGYRPIVEAAAKSCSSKRADHFTASESATMRLLKSISRKAVYLQTSPQSYYLPETLKEALDYKKSNPSIMVITGGTDVALRVTKQHELLSSILDLSHIDELRTVHEGEELHIGASTSLTDVLAVAKGRLPAMYSMLSVFGSRQIRNCATLGGNLGSASPIGDTIPVLMAYDARIVLQSSRGSREVPVREFITGYRKTVCEEDELITRVVFPVVSDGTIVKAYKVSKRKDLDISTLNGGFCVELDGEQHVKEIVLAFGGMAAQVQRASKTEAFLQGKKWIRENIEEAMLLLEKEFSPLSDVRGGATFRRVAARNLLLKFWIDTTANNSIPVEITKV